MLATLSVEMFELMVTQLVIMLVEAWDRAWERR